MAAEATLLEVFELLTGRCDAEGNQLGPRRELTRQRIVKAATDELLEHGYRRMRVDDVASAASVSRPTLYAYFESKELLLIAAMSEEIMAQLPAGQRLLDPTLPAEDRLRDWVSVERMADLVSRLLVDGMRARTLVKVPTSSKKVASKTRQR